MNGKPRLLHKAIALALAALWMLPAAAYGGRRDVLHQFVAGQVLLYAQPGTAQTDITALAALVNASVTPSLLRDCYLLTLPAAQQTDADTLNAVATLKTDPRVRWVAPNYTASLHQSTSGGPPTTLPNDALYQKGLQWGLDLMKMPAAWVLQKSAAGVNVAVCDTGFDLNHPDLIGQYLSDSQDFTTDNPPNVAPGGPGPELQHGVHVSGTIVALTNNNIGVASVCGWGGTKCLGCKVFDNTGAGNAAEFINALTYIKTNATKDGIVSVNCSLGFPGDTTINPNDPIYVAVKAVSDAGVIVVVSAGNDNAPDTAVPAPYPFVITVAATDRNGQKAGYSSFGKVDIAAPGGAGLFNGSDVGGFGPDDILSTRDGGYHYEAGTSMASPHVCGVVALLRSVPNVTPLMVFDPSNPANSVLLSNANSTITGQKQVPDPDYGYGLVDAYKALQQVSLTAVILKPVGINPVTGQSTAPNGVPPSPVETLRPSFLFQVTNIPLSNVNIVLKAQSAQGVDTPIVTNGVPSATLTAQNILTNFAVNGNSSGAGANYTISFRYRFDITSPSVQQTIQISAANPDPTVTTPISDTRTFTITPHTFQSGLTLVSIPVYESATDSPSQTLRDAKTILSAPDAVLYRWISEPITNAQGLPVVQGDYAISGSGSGDHAPAEATLQPSDVATTPQPANGLTNIAPVGLGYFLKIASGAIVKTYGIEITDQLVRIPLREGWNMIGDPFTVAVPFASTEIEQKDGTRITAQDAANAKLILPFIYRYISGDYQFSALPDGTMEPWEGHWVYVIPKDPNNLSPDYNLTLIVPPSGTTASPTGRATAVRPAVTRATTIGPVVSGAGSWSLRLIARAGSFADSYNYIGMSANATDSDDQTKAPKPPKVSSYVSLGLARSRSALYAQDLRALGGKETWNVVVSTDQPNTDITVTWPNVARVPRKYGLILTDTATGQTYNMRSQSSLQVHVDSKNLTRSFTITANPSEGQGRAVISGLFVNPSRSGRSAGSGVYEISYNLSRGANVDISVLGSNGRVVSEVMPSRAATTGQNKVVWDGRGVSGRALSAGIYRLQVRAVTPEGNVSREVYTMTLTGR